MTALPLALICTGFHRSATSVTAQWLHRAGLPMGHWLLGPAPSNPDGHFEDHALITLQDQALSAQGSNWQFYDEQPWYPNLAVDALRRYSKSRDDGTHIWGVKDPRSTLFLPAWQQVLGERGRYLIVLRHWSESIQSLLKRHSEALVFQPEPFAFKTQHAKFWQDPTLAIRMWLAYNRRLLAFAKHNAKQCLLITQRRIFSGIDLPRLVSDQLDIPLQSAASPIKPRYLAEHVENEIQALLPSELIEQAETLWVALLELPAWQADNEEANWSKSSSISSHRSLSTLGTTFKNYQKEQAPLSLEAHLAWLTAQPNTHNLQGIAVWIEQEAPTNFGAWERLARLAMRQSAWALAEAALQRIINEGKPAPYIFQLLGNVRLGMGQVEAAERLFKKAMQGNPRNPAFPMSLARSLKLRGQHGAAEVCLREAIRLLDPAPASLWVALVDAVWQQGRYEDALDLVKKVPPTEEVTEKLASFEMAVDYGAGLHRLKQWRYKLAERVPFKERQFNLMEHSLNDTAREDLLRRWAEAYEKLGLPSEF